MTYPFNTVRVIIKTELKNKMNDNRTKERSIKLLDWLSNLSSWLGSKTSLELLDGGYISLEGYGQDIVVNTGGEQGAGNGYKSSICTSKGRNC